MTLLSLKFFLFLAASVCAYYASPVRIRVYVLSLSSAIFYLVLGFLPFLCIAFVTVISFLFALRIQKGRKEGTKAFFAVGIFLLLAVWIGFRGISGLYGVAIPIGISFYTLRIISYLIDVRRGGVAAERNFLKYLLYTSFFPIAFLGPVANYKECERSLLYPQKASWESISIGILRILFGVFKKTVVADALVEPVRRIASESESYFGAYVLILIIFYSAEVYFDFSGGIDIALGAARLFGVSLPENFNKPFSSKTLAEFWNRWHITLGEWFEHYVFYPISLTHSMQMLSRFLRRKLGVGVGKRIPLYIATLITWVLTGLWHGGALHYAVWGVTNGILVLISSEVSKISGSVCEKHPGLSAARRRLAFLAPVRVFFIIGAVRLLDVYKSTALTFKMLASIFTRTESYISIAEKMEYLTDPKSLIPVVLGLATVFAVSKLGIRSEKICKRPYAFAACVVLILSSSLLFGNYGYGFDASDFIYSQF